MDDRDTEKEENKVGAGISQSLAKTTESKGSERQENILRTKIQESRNQCRKDQ